MKKTSSPHSPVSSLYRSLHRYPHYFLLLLSFLFLGAMAAFLLVLSNYAIHQPQDLRQQAAEGNKAVTVKFTPVEPLGLFHDGQIVVSAESSRRVEAIELDFAASGIHQTIDTITAVVNENAGFQKDKFIVTISPNGLARIQLSLKSKTPANGTKIQAPGVELLRLSLQPKSGDDVSILMDNARSEAKIVGQTDDELTPLSAIRFQVGPRYDSDNKIPPACASHTDVPSTGAVPLTVDLHGSGERGKGVGLKGFRWDFDGNGTWDEPIDEAAINFDPVSHEYTRAGTYLPKFQVQNVNGLYSPVCDYPYPVIATAPTADTSSSENLFFTTDNKLEFYKESSSETIDIKNILAGERYKVRQTVRVQNVIKNANSVDNRSVAILFRANDSATSSKNFAMSQLQKASDGIDLVFETAFVGKTDNAFRTTVDSGNGVAESSENDNVLLTTYKYEVATTTVSQQTITNVCNTYCANDGECRYGLKCWYNQCRHPDNVESDRCTPMASVVTGCNLNCETNRDCAAGLTCSSAKCRNPKSPNSDTCQTLAVKSTAVVKKGEATTTTGQKGDPTVRATAKPSSKPASGAGILMTPLPATDQQPSHAPNPVVDHKSDTVLGDVIGWLGHLPTMLRTTVSQSISQGSNLWYWLIGGGVALILLIVVLSLLGRRNRRSLPPVPPPNPSPTSSFHSPKASPTLLAVPRTLPIVAAPVRTQPSAISVAGSSPAVTAAASPSAAASPAVHPTRPTAPAAYPAPPPAKPGSAMLSRLQQRGVIKPSPSTPAASHSEKASTSTTVFPPKPTS